MTNRKQISFSILSFSAAAFLIFIPMPAHADTTVFACGGKNELPLKVTFDTSGNTVQYQVMEEDGTTPWSKLGTSSASVTADTVFWNADAATDDAGRQYTLDRKSKHLTVTNIENGGTERIVFDEYDCHE